MSTTLKFFLGGVEEEEGSDEEEREVQRKMVFTL
jgi:hypothetical protein